MSRLIDADAIKYKMLYKEDWLKGTGVEKQGVWKEDIDSMPTIDVEPVRHGKWIDEGRYADFFPHHAWRCSECGKYVIEIDVPWYKFCPECGARMDEE